MLYIYNWHTFWLLTHKYTRLSVSPLPYRLLINLTQAKIELGKLSRGVCENFRSAASFSRSICVRVCSYSLGREKFAGKDGERLKKVARLEGRETLGAGGGEGTSDEKERRVEDAARIAHLVLSPFGFRGDAREGAAGRGDRAAGPGGPLRRGLSPLRRKGAATRGANRVRRRRKRVTDLRRVQACHPFRSRGSSSEKHALPRRRTTSSGWDRRNRGSS